MDVALVYGLLSRCDAASQGQGDAEAMEQLSTLCGQAGFLSCLVQILQQQEGVSHGCRLLAVMMAKNVLKHHWTQRQSGVYVASEEEKSMVRQFLLSQHCLLESDKRVAAQLSTFTAEVAKREWTDNKWPELMPALFGSVCTPSVPWLQQSRAMQCLVETLQKLLDSNERNCPPSLRTTFEQTFAGMSSLWTSLSSQLMANVEQMSTAAAAVTVIASSSSGSGGTAAAVVPRDAMMEALAEHLCANTKVMHLILKICFADAARSEALPVFLDALMGQLTQSLSFLRNSSSSYHTVKDEDSYGSDFGVWAEMEEEVTDRMNGVQAMCVLHRKLAREISKIPTHALREFPVELVPFLDPFLQFFFTQLSQEFTSPSQGGAARKGLSSQAFCLNAVKFLSDTLSCRAYKPELTQDISVKDRAKVLDRSLSASSRPSQLLSAQDRGALAAQAAATRLNFFTNERVAVLVELLLHRLLRYSDGELEEWEADPEKFIIGQESLEHYTDVSVRKTSELFLCALLDEDEEGGPGNCMIQILLQHLQNTPSLQEAVQPGASDDNIMFWDCFFTSMAIASYNRHLHSKVPATKWLVEVLFPLATALLSRPEAGALSTGSQQLLRHRVLYVINKWYNCNHFDASVNEQLLNLIVTVVSPSSKSDAVVVNEAVSLLQLMLDRPKTLFAPDLLLPVIGNLMESLCRLTSELEEQDVQASVVKVIASLIDLMGKRLGTMLAPLASHLLVLWNKDQAKSSSVVLQNTVLDAMASMVRVCGSQSNAMHGIVMPLIAYATIGNIEREHLIDSGLDLWLAVIRNVPGGQEGYPVEMNNLLGVGLRGCTEHNKNLEKAMLVVEAHAMLGGRECLVSNAEVLQEVFSGFFNGGIKPELIPLVLRPLEAFFLSCPQEMAQFMSQSGLLLPMLRTCAADTPEFEQVMKPYKEEKRLVITSYLSIVARLLLCGPTALAPAASLLVAQIKALPEGADYASLNEDTLLTCIVTLMFDLFDNVAAQSAGEWRRKLWFLSLLSLYPGCNASLLPFFPDLATDKDKAEAVIFDEENDQAQEFRDGMGERLVAVPRETFYGDDDDDEDDDEETGNGERDKESISIVAAQLLQADIVMATSARALLNEKAAAIQAMMGEAQFASLMRGDM